MAIIRSVYSAVKRSSDPLWSGAAGEDAGVIVFEDFEVDVERFELRRGGEEIPVQPLVFELLVYLLNKAWRVVGKEELVRVVWREAVVGDASVTQAVHLLRKALGEAGRSPRLLKTVHGRGYMLMATPSPGSREETALDER